MKSQILLVSILILSVVLMMVSCLNQETKKQKPEEERTLSELMRDRTDDMRVYKEAILAGEEISIKAFIPFSDGIPSREPLESDEFQAELDAFDSLYRYILTEKPDKDSYQAVISSCISCHERHCPGPLRAIRNLSIDPVSDIDLNFY